MLKYSILFAGLLVPAVVFGGSIDHTVDVDAADLMFDVYENYDHVSIPGFAQLEEPGHPRLPVKVLSFLIPAGARFDRIEIVREQGAILPGTFNIFPAQEPRPVSHLPADVFTRPDPDIYAWNRLYPAAPVVFLHEGDLSGYRIVTLAVNPLRYNPVARQLFLIQTLSFRIHYRTGAPASAKTAKQQAAARTRVMALVANKTDVDAWAPPLKRAVWNSEYIIIADATLASAFEPLKKWKTKKGVPTEIVTTSWIYSNYTGVDNAMRVRNFIKAAADSGALYFLLAGQCDFEHGEEHVPRRDTYFFTSNVGGYTDEDTLPCDLYFADLDGTWNANSNGVYGEFTDGVDGYSDVYVGRAPVKNTSQANNFVSKVITYEKSPAAAFVKKILLPVGNLWSGNYGNGINDTIADTIPNDWQKSKIYESLGLMTRYVTRDSLNQGFNLGHMVGHGNEYGEYYDFGTEIYYYYSDPGTQTNDSTEAAIVNSMGCFCGAVDEAGSMSSYDCLAERMVNLNKSGATATVMNSRYGWGYSYPQGNLGPSGELSVWFYRKLFGTPAYRLGEVLAAAKDQKAGSISEWVWRWCLFEYNLFGDPEMPVWTDTPYPLAVAHSSTVGTGTSNFAVTVKEANNITPVANALVCLMGKNDAGLYAAGYTNASGIATIPITATMPGDTMWVTVTARNRYPYEGFAVVAEAGVPDIPTVVRPLDFARLPETQPVLAFYSTDPQNDNILYRIVWDTDPAFGSPDSSTTALQASGSAVNFTIPSALPDSATYWWKVKCSDPAGSATWSDYTPMRSFTIGTALPANTCSWFQTTAAQFEFNELSGVSIQGDSVILNPSGGQPVADTVLEEHFESGGIPPGWTVIDGNGDGFAWNVGTTGDLGSYTPPNYGSYYAYYSDDDAGSGATNYNEALVSPPVHIPAAAESLKLGYGYGFQVYQTGEVYDVKARFFTGAWSSWSTIASYTASGSGTVTIDLTSYLPADSVQCQWLYHDESSSSHWGWACACDNVLVSYWYAPSNDQGMMTGAPVAFGELSTTCPRPHWGNAAWRKASALDSIGLQVEYHSGAWQLVPDTDLPGNAAGFHTTQAAGSVDLSTLDTLTYHTLRLVSRFARPATESALDPALKDWELGNPAGMETVPPEPFSLVSPEDSALFTVPRPAFTWHATVDTGSGMRDYRVYIRNVLRHTGTDTTWTADYDLVDGHHDWYVVAYDSANNARPSNETWTVVIDTTPPAAVELIAPVNNAYLDHATAGFVWHAAEDNVSGVHHYVLQYALNSDFTQGVAETTLVDTTFSTTLADTIYYWHVRAVDAATNAGPFSSTWQFEIDTLAPSMPALVAPVNGVWLQGAAVTFEWTAAARSGSKGSTADGARATRFFAPVRYILQIDTAETFAAPLYVDTFATTSASITLADGEYCWRVKAFDLAGNQGTYTPRDSFGVDTSPPPAPVLIAPADSSGLNINTVDLIWHAAADNCSGTDHYILQYACNDGFTQGLVETTLVDTTCTAGLADTVYFWRVQAVDAAANAGQFSPVWRFEIDTGVPAAPLLNAPLGGIYLGDTLVTYQWSAVSSAMLRPASAPPRARRTELAMEPRASQIYYVLQIDTTVDFTAPLATDTLDTNATVIDHDEGLYYWRVRACDRAGNQGPYSAPDSFGVDITAPLIDSTSVWNDTSAVGPFEIRTLVIDGRAGVDSVTLFYRRGEDPDWIAAAMLPAGTPGWYVDSIPPVANPYDTVRYYVTATDAAQPCNTATDPAGAPANHYSFTANCTAIEEGDPQPIDLMLEVRGNPVPDRPVFVVSLTQDGTIDLRIYDCSGRIVDAPLRRALRTGVHEIQWPSGLSAGVYFFICETPWSRHTGKVTIVR